MQPRIKKIRQHIILRSLTGTLVLCTFLLSITPKQVLHNIFADHKDSSAKRNSSRLEFNQIGFNCECYSSVATSPYTEATAAIEIVTPIQFSLYTENKPASLFSAGNLYFNLRGPPAISS